MARTGTTGEPDFSFIHAADLELDAPVSGVGRLAAGPLAAARDASLEAFDALVALAVEQRASFLLLAGSICDPGRLGIRAQDRLRVGLEHLGEAGIDTFIAMRGAPLSGWPAIPAWPRGVTVFDADAAGSVVARRGTDVLATIHGVSEDAREGARQPVIRFDRASAKRLEIGVIPRGIGDDPAGDPAWCRPDAMRTARLDYWATAGPRHAILAEGHRSGPWIVAAGSPQGRGLHPDGLGEKGAVVVNVRGGVIQPPEFVPLDRVRYLEVVHDASDHRDRDDLIAGLATRAQRMSEKYPGRGLVLRGILEGAGPIGALVHTPGALAVVLEGLRERASRLDPFVWWDDVRDRMEPLHDRERIRPRANLSAELVGLVDALDADRPGRLSLLERADAQLPAARLAEWLVTGDEDTMLQDAERLALDSLEVGQA